MPCTDTTPGSAIRGEGREGRDLQRSVSGSHSTDTAKVKFVGHGSVAAWLPVVIKDTTDTPPVATPDDLRLSARQKHRRGGI